MDAVAEINAFEAAALAAISTASDDAALEQVRIEYLGARSGRLKDLQSLLGKVPKEEKPAVGKRFNEVKNRVTEALDAAKGKAGATVKPKAGPGIDYTLPGLRPILGKRHPLMQTIAEFKDIMGRFGFTACDGPEIEDEWHNFEALNIPEAHPARDPLDNFYLATAKKGSGAARLMRSQTSTVQIRVMEGRQPPIRVISVGRVYRPDEIDATHHCMFHQMEGLMVGEGVTMAQLKTTLRLFAQAYLGHDVSVRFRPSFFPFTEPSAEMDIGCVICEGAGCRVCSHTGWLEVLGCGMVHPNVFGHVGIDGERYQGFAFGLGVERLAMLRYGVDDLRLFFENDARFLKQFA